MACTTPLWHDDAEPFLDCSAIRLKVWRRDMPQQLWPYGWPLGTEDKARKEVLTLDFEPI